MQTLETITRIPFVDLKAQYDSIKPEIDEAIAAVISQTAFIGGSFLKEFEEAFARYAGVSHCVGVANGTDALFVALKTLGIGPGDEVITAANTFVATSEAIKMAAAAWVVTRVHRLRLVDDRVLVTTAALWTIAVLSLYGVLAWLVSTPLISRYLPAVFAILAVPLVRPLAALLALAWNRHR